MKIEEAIYEYFVQNKITLSAAESCSGGHVATRLISIPGASKYFLGSVVAYSNQMKTEFLGVPEELILEKGAVSEEVALEMLKGILARTKSDYGVAITGIAGPTGGTAEKPIGTVWCAVGEKNKEPQTWLLKARGTRELIIDQSVNYALGKLLMLAKVI